MSPTKILVTGANTGLGKDCARQLALKEGVEKIILACRNGEKAEAARKDLEEVTGREGIFDVLTVDVSDLASVRNAVENIDPIDGLVLNAGGSGGPDPGKVTKDGVTSNVAANVLGHVLLVDLLLSQKKLTGTVIYSSSEAARGVPSFKSPPPELTDGSVQEFVSILDGTFFGDDIHPMYAYSKMTGSLWMSHMARNLPSIRFVAVSPGGTSGTEVFRDLPFIRRFIRGSVVFPLMQWRGGIHPLHVGAKRYVDTLFDEETYRSGVFYASKEGVSGGMCDQTVHLDVFSNETYQDNVNEAIHSFIK